MGKVLGFGVVAVTCLTMMVGAASPSTAVVPASAGTTEPAAKTTKAALVAASDLGDGWTQYRKGGGVGKFSKADCDVKVAATVKPGDTGLAGAMYTNADKSMYVYSTAIAFKTEADAQAYTAGRASSAFENCQAAQDNAAQQKQNPKTYVKLDLTSTSQVGSSPGLEALYSELGGSKAADGTESPTAGYYRYTFRHGPVVYIVKVDAALKSDDASATALANQIGAAIQSAHTAIEGRLTAAGV